MPGRISAASFGMTKKDVGHGGLIPMGFPMLDAKTLEKLLKVSKKKVRGESFRTFYQILGDDHLLSDSHWAIRLPEHLVPAEYRLQGPGKYSDGNKISNMPPQIENLIPKPEDLTLIKPHKINDYVMLAESSIRESMGRILSKPKLLSIFTEEGPESKVLTFFDREFILAFAELYPGANWYRKTKFPRDPCLLRSDEEETEAWEVILMPIFKEFAEGDPK